jgi:cell division septation protein DedD
VQYEYNQQQLISARTSIEKPLFKHGYLNMSYEQNFRSNTKSIEMGFRYDLSFAQTGFSVRNTNNQTTLVESARGSLLYDAKTKYLGVNNRTNVGKGAITLIPFLDVDGNGHRDRGEPKQLDLKFRINGGTIIRNERDSTIRILDLTPYTSYSLELDKNSFDNIAWQMHNPVMKVNIDPNQFKTIEVPISVMGEASGNVTVGSRGQGRILVCFYRSDSTLAARTLTESDGYYSYLGLKPGNYTARIDPEQLKKIKMVSSPSSIPVKISHSFDGDIVEGIDFKLSLVAGGAIDSVNRVAPVNVIPAQVLQAPQPQAKAPNDSVSTKTAATTAKDALPVLTPADAAKNTPSNVKVIYSSTIQIGAFKDQNNALKAEQKLSKDARHPVSIVFENDFYIVRVRGFSGRVEATEFLPKIRKSYPEAYVRRVQ